MQLNRVLAIGKQSYVRIYPNPGICLCYGQHRIACSIYGGIEIFKAGPLNTWQRTWYCFSHVKRPGGKV